VLIVAIGLSIFAGTAQPAASNDELTGLALHDGLTFQQEVDSSVCAKKAQMNLYDAPNSATLTEYLAWYKERLKNFHYVHKVWSNRAQEMLYSPDGLTGVSITGYPTTPGVFAVTYIKMSKALTTHEMDEFSPSNATCK